MTEQQQQQQQQQQGKQQQQQSRDQQHCDHEPQQQQQQQLKVPQRACTLQMACALLALLHNIIQVWPGAVLADRAFDAALPAVTAMAATALCEAGAVVGSGKLPRDSALADMAVTAVETVALTAQQLAALDAEAALRAVLDLAGPAVQRLLLQQHVGAAARTGGSSVPPVPHSLRACIMSFLSAVLDMLVCRGGAGPLCAALMAGDLALAAAVLEAATRTQASADLRGWRNVSAAAGRASEHSTDLMKSAAGQSKFVSTLVTALKQSLTCDASKEISLSDAMLSCSSWMVDWLSTQLPVVG
ncbi:hypothetical protein COO60DRAFT_1637096 [Scenedesmus sp. NREL 46B-D3]|nr:hypothetical protein COO60DRAFT_1637096 [Scenedesmus sp. NREL 46B-D3]